MNLSEIWTAEKASLDFLFFSLDSTNKSKMPL